MVDMFEQFSFGETLLLRSVGLSRPRQPSGRVTRFWSS